VELGPKNDMLSKKKGSQKLGAGVGCIRNIQKILGADRAHKGAWSKKGGPENMYVHGQIA